MMATSLSIPSSGDVTRLVVLALLACRPMHGYELRREIEFRKMDQWADVKYGSIYPALRRLAASGAIEAIGTDRAGNLPVRTSYRITSAGQEELRELLREAWRRPRLSAHAVDVALAFFSLLHRQEIEQLLEERLHALDGVSEALRRAEQEPVSPEQGVAAIVDEILDHTRVLAAAERKWTQRVLRQMRAGSYGATPAGREPGSSPSSKRRRRVG